MMSSVLDQADLSYKISVQEIKPILNEFKDVDTKYNALEPLLKYFHKQA